MGGVTALLFSTLAISNPAYALNTSIGNTVNEVNGDIANGGQSFINDPSGTDATINLNTWTFGFFDPASQSTEALTTLTIRNGTGNAGSVVGTSAITSTGTLGGSPSVTWTFAGGLAITDTSTYTAVLAPSLIYVGLASDDYPNGDLTIGTQVISGQDLVFQGTFSATPVPFEFSPALGLVGLGALCAGKKFLFKK